MTVNEIVQIIVIAIVCIAVIAGVIGLISTNRSMNNFYKRLVPGALMEFSYTFNENPFTEREPEVFKIKILDVKDGWCKYCFWRSFQPNTDVIRIIQLEKYDNLW